MNIKENLAHQQRTKKIIELPLMEPIYGTYHSGILTACFVDNPTLRNHFLNEKGILMCSRDFLLGHTALKIDVEGIGINDSRYYSYTTWMPMQYLQGQVKAVIRNFIKLGFCVYFSKVDDYYVEGKSNYNQRHFSHDGAICGYNQEDKTFCIYAYDNNWVYRKFWTPQKAFEAGRLAMFKKKEFGFMYAIKAREFQEEFSSEKALKMIVDYLDSDMEKYPENGEGNVRGIVVHQYVLKYIDRLYNGIIPHKRMDWRIFRPIWEHKKLMLERIQCIENQLGMKPDISEQYKVLVDEADDIRFKYARYHQKPKDSILPIIREKFIKIDDEEFRLLSKLVDETKKITHF